MIRSHITSHYTWESVTTLHDFGGVLGWPLDTFFWALTISWSRLLARVWSGPDFAYWVLIRILVASESALIRMSGSLKSVTGWEPSVVTDEPVDVQDFMKMTGQFRGICKVYLKLLKKNRKITTFFQFWLRLWLDLETLGSWQIVPKSLLVHWLDFCQMLTLHFPERNCGFIRSSKK